jgi:hypothetical protein
MRLSEKRLYPVIQDYPICYLPIEIMIHQESGFDDLIKEYVQRNKRVG